MFGNAVRTEWSSDSIALGASVYLSFSEDRGEVIRYGKVTEMDFAGHPLNPWRVEVRYGKHPEVQNSLGLDENGTAWFAEDSYTLGIPSIVGVSPRFK